MPRGAPHTVMGSAVSIDTCLVFGNFLPLLRNTSVFLARITGDINCFNKVNRRRKTARHSPFFCQKNSPIYSKISTLLHCNNSSSTTLTEQNTFLHPTEDVIIIKMATISRVKNFNSGYCRLMLVDFTLAVRVIRFISERSRSLYAIARPSVVCRL